MIAYKVVTKDLKSWISSLSSISVIEPSVIQYKLNEWVETYYACCFKRLKFAEEFVRSQGFGNLIFKCEIEQAKLYKKFYPVIIAIPSKRITSDKSELNNWPDGTIFARKVKLLKEVKIK